MSLIQFVNNLPEALVQGDVVVIGGHQNSLIDQPDGTMPVIEAIVTERAYDTRVCGVVSDLYTEHKPETNGERERTTTRVKPAKAKASKANRIADQSRAQAFTLEELAQLDRTKVKPGQLGYLVTHGFCAHCKVDADIAPIKAGDLLAASPTKGYAQKVVDKTQAVGGIIGKALGSLAKGKGKIPVLVLLE